MHDETAAQTHLSRVAVTGLMLVAPGYLNASMKRGCSGARGKLTPAFAASQFEHMSPQKYPEFGKRVVDVYHAAGVPK